MLRGPGPTLTGGVRLKDAHVVIMKALASNPSVWLVFLALSLVGCGQSLAATSVLQRFDRLHQPFERVTYDGSRLAMDWAALGLMLRQGNARQISARASRLGTDALKLGSDAGLAAYRMRTLRNGGTRTVHRYFALVAAALSAEWWESHWSAQLATLVTRDPWLGAPAGFRQLYGLERAARGSASRATVLVEQARLLRKNDPRMFRYVPVR